MVAGAPQSVIRAPGKLVVGATDLSAADPYGGTEIGLVNAQVLTPLGEPRVIQNEGLGEPTDVLEAGNDWLYTCFLRGADDDAKELLLKGWRSAGATSSHGVLTFPGKVPGESLVDYSNVLILFVPENLIDHDAFIAYRAIPWFSAGAEILFRRSEEYGFPMSFRLLRNASGNTHQIGRLTDLSLS